MEKRGNKYDLIGNAVQTNEKVLIIDSELFFTIHKSGMLWWKSKTYELSEFNRKFVRYLKNVTKRFDSVLIGCVEDTEYKREKLNLLQVAIPVIDFETEVNYQVWMKMTNPTEHFATLRRRNYFSNSTYITDDLLN